MKLQTIKGIQYACHAIPDPFISAKDIITALF